ncbi:unnamed protein product [Musa banksii]
MHIHQISNTMRPICLTVLIQRSTVHLPVSCLFSAQVKELVL